jgi:hypothetical protein
VELHSRPHGQLDADGRGAGGGSHREKRNAARVGGPSALKNRRLSRDGERLRRGLQGPASRRAGVNTNPSRRAISASSVSSSSQTGPRYLWYGSGEVRHVFWWIPSTLSRAKAFFKIISAEINDVNDRIRVLRSFWGASPP